TIQPSSALERSCEIGFSRLPLRSRGAARSSESRMAVSATAAGVTITEVRATGLSGGPSTSAGRRAPALGRNWFIAQTALANETTTTSPPAAILPQGIGPLVKLIRLTLWPPRNLSEPRSWQKRESAGWVEARPLGARNPSRFPA